eukprot:TRINITY_DN326_c0_g1_i1.p1 TRINITY_DN326_c0_g1~~TRINITY_DN326_c0_g1_i1.p1  ORF type:complete len:159 (-),score=47.21 TRINITY_DN326_c0_g1_i1:258-734(-)
MGKRVEAPQIMPLLSEEALKGGCRVTLAFMAVYTVFFMIQLLVKIILVKRAQWRGDDKFTTYNTMDPRILIWDRAVGNMLEQAIIFLPSVWLALITADASSIASIVNRGYAYVAFRALWPAAWKYVGPKYVTPAILLCTGPMYLINFSLFYDIYKAVA